MPVLFFSKCFSKLYRIHQQGWDKQEFACDKVQKRSTSTSGNCM